MNLGKLNSYFGDGTVLKGSLKFKGVLRFDGDFEGDVTTQDTFIIGETGKVKATVKVGALHNFGKISGNVEAQKNISLHTNSKLEGNISTPSLVTEDMAFFEGSCVMPIVERPDHSEADLIAAAVSGPASSINPYELVGKEAPSTGGFLSTLSVKQKMAGAGTGAFLIILVMIWIVFGGEKRHGDAVSGEETVAAEQGGQQISSAEAKPENSAGNAVNEQDIAGLKKEIEANQQNPQPYMTLAKISLGKRDYRSAIEALTQGATAMPKNEEIATLLGQTLLRTGKEKEAMKYFTALAQINPASAEAMNNDGFQKMDSGSLEQAVSLFKNALQKDPANYRSRIGLASVYSKQEENDKAAQECLAILKDADDYAPAMNRLAWIYAKQGANLNNALTLSQKSLAIFDDIPEYIDTLSEVNYKLGNYNDAVKLIKKAIELVPSEPYYRRQLFKFQKSQRGRAAAPQQQPAAEPQI